MDGYIDLILTSSIHARGHRRPTEALWGIVQKEAGERIGLDGRYPEM